MTIALRLNDELVHEAETEGLLTKRSTPKQIEFWAQIGKAVAHQASGSDLLALTQGLSEIQLNPLPSAPVDPDKVFSAVDRARKNGHLRQAISKARVRYEASLSQTGLLDRIHPDGHRETGHFKNGEFIIAP